MRTFPWFFLLLIISACTPTESTTVIEGKVVGQDTGLPKPDVTVRISGIKEIFMGSNVYITEHTLVLDADGNFELSVSHPEVNYFTILLIENSNYEIIDPNAVHCSPYACLDLPAGRKYELEIRVGE